MNDADDTPDATSLWLMLAVFGGTALLAVVDLAADLRGGTSVGHVLAEGAIVVLGLLGGALVARALRAALRRARELAGSLSRVRAEAERYRAEAKDAMQGLARAIDQQFERWQLSPAEKEVGLLLLKGLSHKEIADLREVTEATARQQARAVYRKAGLGGRADLAAFFLEDLLLPARRDARP